MGFLFALEMAFATRPRALFEGGLKPFFYKPLTIAS
jgi:hypothetical protein